MNTTNVIQLVVFAMIGAILLVAFVPIAMDAQTSASTEVNYDNESTLFKMADSNEEVTVVLNNGDVTLNGETVTHTSNSNIVLSDAYSIDQFLYQGNWLTRTWAKDDTVLHYPSAFNLTYNNGTVSGTITSGGETVTISQNYTYLFYADDNGKYTQFSSNSGIDVYVNDVKDIILAGLYYTGENSTTYSYIDGVLTVEGDYTSSVSFVSEKVGIDVYHVTGITVTIGDESFTPYRFLVPTEVVGHTETPLSSIIALLPLIAGVGLLLFVLGGVFKRYY